MGGDLEKTMVPKKAQSGLSPKSQNRIRHHINGNTGEVHFHDDTAKKKVAVDVADYHKFMDDFKLKCGVGDSKSLIGKDGRSVVIFECIINDQNEIDVNEYIEDVKLGNNYQQLLDLAAGK
jgi:hypothetical protein